MVEQREFLSEELLVDVLIEDLVLESLESPLFVFFTAYSFFLGRC